MALAKVARESGRTLNGRRRFGRSMENGIDLNGEHQRSVASEPSSVLLSSPPDSLMDKSCCLDVVLKLLDASSTNLSTLSRHSPALTEFISCFIATHTGLLRDNSSPLLESDRYFIALMAAETHRCHSLVCIYANEYLLHGGDVKWLQNFCAATTTTTSIPRKFSLLCEINEILAHTPWLITKEHISKLAAAVQGERWSIAELIQAVIILTHVHSLASLLAGFRLVPGQTTTGRAQTHNDSNHTQNSTKLSIGGRHDDAAFKKRVPNRSGIELLERFLSDPSMSCAELCDKRNKQLGSRNGRLSPHYFSWEVQGYSLANITNVQFGDLIDAELKSVKKLFNTCSDHTVIGGRCKTANLMENVSTEVSDSKKCFAIWQYVHCLLGICYDDYKYSQLDVLLSANLRSYIKLVTCSPERLSEDGFHDVTQSINDCEKMSVHAIVSEARLQVELMFSLNAILDHQTESDAKR